VLLVKPSISQGRPNFGKTWPKMTKIIVPLLVLSLILSLKVLHLAKEILRTTARVF